MTQHELTESELMEAILTAISEGNFASARALRNRIQGEFDYPVFYAALSRLREGGLILSRSGRYTLAAMEPRDELWSV